eukprot:8653512-Pyramimonas_sp.AAC.1
MNLKEDEVVMLLKKAYGLCDALKEWFDEILSKMSAAVWVAMELEPRPSILCDSQKIAGIAFADVDQMAIGIDSSSVLATRRLKELRGHWN